MYIDNTKELKYIFFISSQIEPQCYVEAIQLPKWVKAIERKVKALETNDTWKIVDIPTGNTPLVVSGFIKSNEKLIEMLKDTRHASLRRVTLSVRKNTILICIHFWQDSRKFVWFLLLLLSKNGISNKTLITFFCMETCVKKCTYFYYSGSLNVSIIKYVN